MVYGLLNEIVERSWTWQWGALPEAHARDPHNTHAQDPHMGLQPPVFALLFGIVSGLSLPLGAYLGIRFSPVSDRICALMMAFGAGALLFAVTVELYGHALHEVAAGRSGLLEMSTTIFGALIGAAFYLSVNGWLEKYLAQGEEDTQGLEDGTQVPVVPKESDPLIPPALRNQSATTPDETPRSGFATASSPIPPPQTETRSKRRASELWGKAKKQSNMIKAVSTMPLLSQDDLQKVRAREKAMRAMNENIQKSKSVAFALFLGLLVDGVPEGILMGFLAAEGHLTPVLIISLFVANFPEAFSSASLLIQAQLSVPRIVGMWTGLCLLVGCLGGFSCWQLLLWFPKYGQAGHSDLPMPVLLGIAFVEGITGGAMLACISSVMLPEAFERAGKEGPFYTQSGFLSVSGFLLSVALKAFLG